MATTLGPKARVIVTGLVGLHPVGGVAWDYLQYVMGFARLGHEVYYYEDTWSWPYDPVSRTSTSDPAYSIGFLKGFFERHAPGLREHWRYVHLHDQAYGLGDRAWSDVLRSADIFLNVSGASIVPDGLNPACTTVFIDTDPGYNQIVMSERPAWSENIDRWIEAVRAHHRHFTYAENIHGPDCQVPLVGIDWQTTRMPIDMDAWRGVGPPADDAPWTTVMTWNAFKGPLTYRGREYLSKNGEFAKLIDLPRRASVPLEVAMGGADAPLGRLRDSGWSVVDGPEVTLSPQGYIDYLAGSRGEISPAKQVYVALRTGWFSTRSACYLAAGRPVVVQDTGFRSIYPTGTGLIAFDDADEALDAIEKVSANLQVHARAAREIAGDCFAAPFVLKRMLHDIETGP
jgi:hypothetical protein